MERTVNQVVLEQSIVGMSESESVATKALG